MAATQPGISSVLRKTLLLKVLSKPQPTREDVQSVVELTAAKVVEALQAQSMTLYLVEGNDICFKHVYYSPTLWAKEPLKEKEFSAKREKLMKLKIPLGGTSMVGRVIEAGTPAFLGQQKGRSRPMVNLFKDTGFEVRTMVTGRSTGLFFYSLFPEGNPVLAILSSWQPSPEFPASCARRCCSKSSPNRNPRGRTCSPWSS